jgi:hypothetical protein
MRSCSAVRLQRSSVRPRLLRAGSQHWRGCGRRKSGRWGGRRRRCRVLSTARPAYLRWPRRPLVSRRSKSSCCRRKGVNFSAWARCPMEAQQADDQASTDLKGHCEPITSSPQPEAPHADSGARRMPGACALQPVRSDFLAAAVADGTPPVHRCSVARSKCATRLVAPWGLRPTVRPHNELLSASRSASCRAALAPLRRPRAFPAEVMVHV